MSKQTSKGSAKRIHFYNDEDSHVRFKACLTKHNMTMSEFLRICCKAVVDDDDNMSAFLTAYRKKSESHSKRNNAILERDKKKGDKILQEFGFEDKDIQKLFDTIADHNPEI